MLTASGSQSVRPHKVFKQLATAQMKKDKDAWTIYFMLYTGLRIEEMLKIKTSDIDFEEQCILGGIKTPTGTNRIIPINRHLLPIIKRNMGINYLVEYNGKRMSYNDYRKEIWNVIMKKYGYDYTPHDTRHTFVTNLNRANVSDVVIAKIVGHVPRGITSRYTHISLEEMLEAVNKLS